MHGLIQCTTKTKTLIINADIKTINSENLINYQNKEMFDTFCSASCKNYGNKWSCPPYSPEFSLYRENYIFLTICVLFVDLSQFEYIENNYLKIKAANSIMKSRMDRILRSYIQETNFKMISTGSCRLCKPCKKKLEQHCRYPKKMAYSFEAMGIDVEKLSTDIFNHKLLWYKDKKLPEYTSVVTGILSDTDINHTKLFDSIING